MDNMLYNHSNHLHWTLCADEAWNSIDAQNEMIVHMNNVGLAVTEPVKNCAGNLKSMKTMGHRCSIFKNKIEGQYFSYKKATSLVFTGPCSAPPSSSLPRPVQLAQPPQGSTEQFSNGFGLKGLIQKMESLIILPRFLGMAAMVILLLLIVELSPLMTTHFSPNLSCENFSSRNVRNATKALKTGSCPAVSHSLPGVPAWVPSSVTATAWSPSKLSAVDSLPGATACKLSAASLKLVEPHSGKLWTLRKFGLSKHLIFFRSPT
jgi:hypothetical protein